MGAYSREGAYCKLLALTWGLIRARALIEGRGLNRGFTVLTYYNKGANLLVCSRFFGDILADV